MKLAAIKKLCMDRGCFLIINGVYNRQWLSNGAAAFPVDGVRLNEESIPGLFDLTPKQLDKVRVNMIDLADERFDVNPQPDYETPLEDLGAIWYSGDLYRALVNEDGMLFVAVSRLKPAENKSGALEFYARTNAEGNAVIAAYGDMLVSAIIVPEGAETAEKLMEIARGISLETLRTMSDPDAEADAERAEREAEAAARQQKMDMGGESGSAGDGEPE